jgi:hypothetical protein
MDEMMLAVQQEVQKIMEEFMAAQMVGREYLNQEVPQEVEVDNGEVYSQNG